MCVKSIFQLRCAAIALATVGLTCSGAKAQTNVTPAEQLPTTDTTARAGATSLNANATPGDESTSSSSSADAQTAGQTSASMPVADPSAGVLEGNFFNRLLNAYKQDWAGTTASGPTPARRGLQLPLRIHRSRLPTGPMAAPLQSARRGRSRAH